MSELILYTSEDGKSRIQLRAKDQTVWLSQREMAELLDVSTDNVGLHLKNLYEDGELSREATTEESSVVQIEGTREVQRTPLLLNVRKKMGPNGIGKIFGQEKNITTYNLARMNMLLHGVKDTEFEIFHGDTLLNDWEMLKELNPAKKPYFDAIVANPPFSYRWDPTDAMGDDVRFKNHGLAPKSAADFAFLLHGFHFLKD